MPTTDPRILAPEMQLGYKSFSRSAIVVTTQLFGAGTPTLRGMLAARRDLLMATAPLPTTHACSHIKSFDPQQEDTPTNSVGLQILLSSLAKSSRSAILSWYNLGAQDSRSIAAVLDLFLFGGLRYQGLPYWGPSYAGILLFGGGSILGVYFRGPRIS